MMAATEAKVASCESSLNYNFQAKLLGLKGLQAGGDPLVWQDQEIKIEKNDLLAVFGDSIVSAHLCKQWLAAHRRKGGLTFPSPIVSCLTTIKMNGTRFGRLC